MAKPTVTKYEPFYKGDTQNFAFVFKPPFTGYSWSTVTLDCAMTNITAPTDNSGALASRINQMLVVDPITNYANYTFALTHAESINAVPGSTYMIQPQLKEATAGQPNYATPLLCVVEIYQDYVI